MLQNTLRKIFLAGCTALAPLATLATVFPLPEQGNMVGNLQAVTSHRDDTLLDIGRFYDIGYNQEVGANPGVNPWLPGQASKVIIPNEYVLPPKPWSGIVVNIPARRIYFFPEGRGVVFTYPVGVFLPGWKESGGIKREIEVFESSGRRVSLWSEASAEFV